MIIEAVGTVFKRKQETNPDTRYLIEKTDIRFFWGTFIVHSYSMLSCYLYWHVSSAGCSFVLCCVNVLTHAKTFYHFIINNTGIDMLGSYYIFTYIWRKRIVYDIIVISYLVRHGSWKNLENYCESVTYSTLISISYWIFEHSFNRD